MPLLEMNSLNVRFPTKAGVVIASDQVSLKVEPGQTLCLAGESGCGKSIVALSIMRLLPSTARVSGEIRWMGQDLLSLPESRMRQIRGKEISMIFEQPARCLNPVIKAGEQIAEAVVVHDRCSRKEARKKAVEMMEQVGIPDPEKRFHQYPHEFSGGMIQRVMIAMALVSRPQLLIADEPTTALDITIQHQMVELLVALSDRFGTAVFLITHDLGVAARLADTAAVMYAGSIIETGSFRQVLETPRHPYTRALIGAASNQWAPSIPGTVPELSCLPDGCRFHPRCSQATDICRHQMPGMCHGVRCHLNPERDISGLNGAQDEPEYKISSRR